MHNSSKPTLAQFRSSAADAARANRALGADRAGVSTDRFGGAAARSRPFARGNISRDTSRFETTSGRSSRSAGSDNGDNFLALGQAKKAVKKGETLKGLRDNQASCDRKFPNTSRFNDKTRLIDSRCATGRR